MEYVYTALLLHSAKQEINEGNIKKVLDASGIKAEDAKIKALISALEGVNIDDVIKQTAIPVAAAPAAGEKKAEGEKKEKPEDTEKKSEEAVAGLASLFG